MDKLLRVAVEDRAAFDFLAKRADIARIRLWLWLWLWGEASTLRAAPQKQEKPTGLRVISRSTPEPKENLRYAA
jgi:hypothetical protein